MLLPTMREVMKAQGRDQLDVILVADDAHMNSAFIQLDGSINYPEASFSISIIAALKEMG